MTASGRARLRRATVLGLGLALGAGAVTATSAHAAPSLTEISLEAPATAEAGDEIEVVVSVTDAADLYAYEITLGYDAAILEPVDGSATLPEGGFDSTDAEGDAIVLAHTRLGTSPGLEGDLTLATSAFTTIGDGQTTVEVTSVTLVGADGETLQLEDAAAASIDVTAVDEPDETPTPEPTEPQPGTDDDEGTDDTSPDETGGVGGGTDDASGSSGPLPNTRASVGLLLMLAAAAITTGVALLRRRAMASR